MSIKMSISTSISTSNSVITISINQLIALHSPIVENRNNYRFLSTLASLDAQYWIQ